MYMSPTPKPLWSKRSLMLMFLVLGAGMLLGGAAFMSTIQEKERDFQQICNNQMLVTIVFSNNNENSTFEFRDSTGYHYQPVLESNQTVISKTGPARICYSNLEKNTEGIGRIYVSGIEYLPLSDEDK